MDPTRQPVPSRVPWRVPSADPIAFRRQPDRPVPRRPEIERARAAARARALPRSAGEVLVDEEAVDTIEGVVTPEPTLAPAPPASENLPSPPTDEEQYWYFGRQHRWLLAIQASAFVAVAYSASRLALSRPAFVILLGPIMLFTLTMIVSFLSSTRRRRIDRIDHEHLVTDTAARSRSGLAAHASVDVFLPTAGEPLAVLANTYRHVSRLQWPGDVRVYVLDDAARSDVRLECERYGFTYMSRPDRGHLKKAGNLRYAYERTGGDLIMILDADFAPRPDFIEHLAPYFDEPEVGIVQSPQFFDASKRMHWLERGAGATQELFYRWVQPSRDRSNAAICVGSCAMYRRDALRAAGGFAQIGHSEDVHTGVNMMRVGFVVRYVPIVLAKGLCPDSLGGFMNQQYRWCTGSMSLLRDQSFHDNRLITWRQRLCFWAGFLYYITTAVNVLVAPLVVTTMVWFVPGWIAPRNSLFVVGGLLMWIVVYPLMMRCHWRISVLRVQMLYSYAHLTAIWHLVRGRTREWVATGAATTATPIATTCTRVMRTHVVLSQTAIAVGLVRAIALHGIAQLWTVAALACVAAYIQLPAVVTARTSS